MKLWQSASALLAASALSMSAVADPLPVTPIPIEALARLPAITGATISPDGKHIAALVSVNGQRWPVISVWDTDDLTKPPTTIASSEMRPRAVSFVGNEKLLFAADQPWSCGSYKGFTVQNVVTDFDGRNFSQPFGGSLYQNMRDQQRTDVCDTSGPVEINVIVAGTVADPNKYIVVQTATRTGVSSVSSLDVSTMRVERFMRLGDDESLLVADVRDGQPMVKETLVSEGGAWKRVRQIRNRSSGGWETHPELNVDFRNRVTMAPLGFYDPTNANKLYVATNSGGNFTQIRVYDITTKTWEAEPAFAAPDFDVADVRLMINRETKQLVGVGAFSVDGPAHREIFVDDTWAGLQRTLEAQFPGQQVRFGVLARGGRTIVTVSGPRNSPAYYLLNGRELKLLGRERSWLSPQSLSETTFVRFAARDGLSIPAFITLPPGYNKATHGRIPVVVHPHGGPWARDYLGWDSSGWTQFMASRGYAVIQPQYRGSEGWGMALWKAGDREWGQKMSDDNDDAAAYLVSEGIGDSGRMAIFGYSYGGFASIAASVRPNSPYRCALSGAGVADLGRLANLWGASRLQREYQGWTVAGMNPIDNVRNANIPILLYHGDRDRQADTIHSRDFNRAMRGAGKRVQYVEIKDMWHQLPWWPEWHRESLTLINDWLAGPNCFGGAPPAAAQSPTR